MQKGRKSDSASLVQKFMQLVKAEKIRKKMEIQVVTREEEG